jgi:hypothetical protein
MPESERENQPGTTENDDHQNGCADVETHC